MKTIIPSRLWTLPAAAGLAGLSQRRADSVKAYLVTQGIGAARLVAVGRGEFVPVADNGFAAGRQANRRVEVLIDHALD